MIALDFKKGGSLIPVVTQDETGLVLMLAYMNEEAWEETLATGRVCYFSRSKQKLWRKGETSGHIQTVREIFVDCDMDAVVITVAQEGAACHTGKRSCFYRKVEDSELVMADDRFIDPSCGFAINDPRHTGNRSHG